MAFVVEENYGKRLFTACYTNYVMGVITIEVPQKIEKKYTIRSKAMAQKVLDSLDSLEPRKLRDLSDVVGIWSDRKQSADELARELRRMSNLRRTPNG